MRNKERMVNRDSIVRTPDPQRFIEAKGREIEGLISRPERFRHLQPGVDMYIARENPRIVSAQKPQEFVVFADPSHGEEELTVHAPHWRSIDAGTGTFWVKGKTKNAPDVPYYVVNVKGCGFLKPTLEGGNLDEYKTWTAHKKGEFTGERDEVILGLCAERELGIDPEKVKSDKEDNAISMSQYVIDRGLRGEVYWALAALQRMPFHGEMLSVQELWARGVIPKDTYPYEAIRLLKINTRIEEAAKNGDRRSDIFEQAFEVFNNETRDAHLEYPQLDVQNAEHQEIFFTAFLERIAENVAILLHANQSHGSLHSANITMAAEFVDLELYDIREELEGTRYQRGDAGGLDRAFLKDMRDVAYSCRALLRAGELAGMEYGGNARVVQAAINAFTEKLRDLEGKRKRGAPIDKKVVTYWFSEIMRRVLVERQKLPSLVRGAGVADWGIPFPVESEVLKVTSGDAW